MGNLSYRRGLYCCSFSSIGHFSRPQSVNRTTGRFTLFLCPKVFFAYRAESLAFGTHRDMDATKPTSDEKVKGGNSIVSSSCAGLTSDVPPRCSAHSSSKEFTNRGVHEMCPFTKGLTPTSVVCAPYYLRT